MILPLMIDDNPNAEILINSLARANEDLGNTNFLLVQSDEDVRRYTQNVIDAWRSLLDKDRLVVFMDYKFDDAPGDVSLNGAYVVRTAVDSGVPLEVFLGVSMYFVGWGYKGKHITELCRTLFNDEESVLAALSRVPSKAELL